MVMMVVIKSVGLVVVGGCATEIGDRCYDHNFRRFSAKKLAIFGEKIGDFLGDRCYDHNFLRFSAKKLAFFSKTNVMNNFFAKLVVV
jgi:hypothetical protein